jgi:membrane protein DedA with SNARE-associated domain
MTLDFILLHFAWLGPWFFFLGATAEALPIIGTFLPGATIVTMGGFAAAHGYFPLPVVLAFSIIGAISGDVVSYYVGFHGGKLIRRKHIIKEALLQKGENFFHKYGNQSILWGRFIGPLRSILPFLSGLLKVKQSTFWFWNIISGIIWGFFYVLVGYFSGNLFSLIVKRWNYRLTSIVILSILALLITWLTKHHGQSIRQYFISSSAKFAKRVENLKLLKKLEHRYPALSEIFIWPAYQLKLYLGFIGLVILIITSILALIFDWI